MGTENYPADGGPTDTARMQPYRPGDIVVYTPAGETASITYMITQTAPVTNPDGT